MHRFRSVFRVVPARLLGVCIVAYLLTAMAARISAQANCGSNPSAFPIGYFDVGYFDQSDGKLHIRYSTPAEFAGNLAQAFEQAMGELNLRSSDTGVQFDWVEEGPTDVEFGEDSEPGYDTEANRILWSQNLADIANGPGNPSREATGIDLVAWLFLHEFSHFLGAGEGGVSPASPTVTNQLGIFAGQTYQTALENNTPPTLHFLVTDAQKLHQCWTFSRIGPPGGGDSYIYEDEGEDKCYYVYLVTSVYICDQSGCLLYSQQREFLGIRCEPLND